MKRFPLWITLSTLFGAAFAAPLATLPLGSQAMAQPLAQTPLSSVIEVTGNSGGSQGSNCGSIAASPNQVLQVTEPFVSINISVQSSGDYTLLIKGPSGFNECVLAHEFGGGTIESPGVLNQGTYEIYVGDRGGASNPFTLRIQQ